MASSIRKDRDVQFRLMTAPDFFEADYASELLSRAKSGCQRPESSYARTYSLPCLRLIRLTGV